MSRSVEYLWRRIGVGICIPYVSVVNESFFEPCSLVLGITLSFRKVVTDAFAYILTQQSLLPLVTLNAYIYMYIYILSILL